MSDDNNRHRLESSEGVAKSGIDTATDSATELDAELSALCDGELSVESENQLRSRIDGDTQLSERFAEFASLGAELKALEGPSVPSDLHARLQAKIDASDTNATPQPAKPAAATIRWPLVAAMAAGLAVVWLLQATLQTVDPSAPQLADDRAIGQSTELAVAAVADAPTQSVTETTSDDWAGDLSDDEIEIAFELETLLDLEMIQELDLLEAMFALESEQGERG